MKEKFLEFGIDIGFKTGEFHTTCPKCSHKRKKKTEHKQKEITNKTQRTPQMKKIT